MRVVRVIIRNFRGIASCLLNFDGTTVFLGDNNIGKSTVLEAIELAIGPDRIARSNPIDEHDFYGGRYRDAEGNPIELFVEVVIAGLGAQQQSTFRHNLEHWRAADKKLLGYGEIGDAAAEGVEGAVRVQFRGYYDAENDEFATRTFFAIPCSDENEPVSECRTKDKREFGFLHLRALRTGNRALSMERGSLLDVILKTYEVRAQVWERLLEKLRVLDVIGDQDPEFGKILTDINDAIREIVPGEWADAPHLRVSELTREDLRHVLKSFMATGVQGYAAPFQHQGSGTINALVMAMLGLIAERRKGQVIFAMEEPELGLPPHVQKRVVDRVRSLASQALFTSHSPYVIEEFTPGEMMVVTRDNAGTLVGAAVNLPANLKPKAFREGVRTRFCEALVARRVVVAEGKTECIAYASAARRAEALAQTAYSRLDKLGWVVFDAVGQGTVALFAEFFKGLGKTVASIFDKQSPDELAKIIAVSHAVFEQPYAGFEQLLKAEIPIAAQARFVRELQGQGEWPAGLQNVLPQSGAPDSDYAPALYELLKHKKGDEFIPALFAQCTLAELPQTMLKTLAELKKMAASPAAPQPLVANPSSPPKP